MPAHLEIPQYTAASQQVKENMLEIVAVTLSNAARLEILE